MLNSIKKWLPFKRGDRSAAKTAAVSANLHPLQQLHREVNQLFGRVLHDSAWPWSLRSEAETGLFGDFSAERFQPTIDIADRPEHFLVTAELPGMDADDIDIEVGDDALVIRGQKKLEESSDDAGYYRTERFFGAFERAIPLPDDIDPDGTEARFKKGVLTVRLAKLSPQRAAKRIEIRTD